MDIQEQLTQALKEIGRLKKENIQLKKDLYKIQGRLKSLKIRLRSAPRRSNVSSSRGRHPRPNSQNVSISIYFNKS
ncbi:hypothetical protein BKP37_06530 [Anaerobacillus alkalilacustris]|uniref:Transposase n=1 Tax=Anaerobacillus alkalilacustris TaxID=393763 RepID=A0A1S2LS37_9BACI|nr:hypothetical protein BKP37_06530 [Anaerobacillus alkalilacustris]